MKKLTTILIFIILILSFATFHFACKSYTVHWNDNLPGECNMALNMIKSNIESKNSSDKSITVMPVDKCYRALRQIRCTERIYKKDYDSENQNLKNEYNECLKELGGM